MTTSRMKTPSKIAFQGAKGAYSDLAARKIFPNATTIPCPAFEDAFKSLSSKKVDFAVIPIENTIAGRVSDVHHLLPEAGLYIVGEHFQPIRHALMGPKGSTLNTITHVHSHVMALPQCRNFIRQSKLIPVTHSDTAGAAQEISEKQDPTQAAIASEIAAEIYGLKILKKNIQDTNTNVTRFVILANKPITPPKNSAVITSFVFNVRHIPAALYKALGGFATNGINMLKLESYVDENFSAARFYCEVEGHPDTPAMHNAFEELGFYANNIKMLGTYPSARKTIKKAQKKA